MVGSSMNHNSSMNHIMQSNTLDKYYTKEAVVEVCISLIKETIKINALDIVIEPSAGNGSFIKEIKKINKNVQFYDIEPEHDEIIRQDYLTLKVEVTNNKIHVIGNPPFGRQSSLAIKFIKKSCEFCNTLSFILPKSFKKDSLQKKIPLNFHLVNSVDLPEKSFTLNNKDYDVPCIFQIWEKKAYNRTVIENILPLNFIFVKKTDTHDISFRRVGVNAGAIDTYTSEKSIQSHYFIRFKNESFLTKLNEIRSIKYDINNTVGPKSISKQEVILHFNKVMK